MWGPVEAAAYLLYALTLSSKTPRASLYNIQMSSTIPYCLLCTPLFIIIKTSLSIAKNNTVTTVNI